MVTLSNGLLEVMCKQVTKVEVSKQQLEDFKRYEEFASSVGCLIAEGSEFMTKEQLYDAIKNVFNRIILKQEEKDND